MFVWRLAHNSLVNRMEIHKLGVDLDTRCPVCHRLNEDGGHIFLKCKKVTECWSILATGETRENLLHCDSAHSMLQELWKCDEDNPAESCNSHVGMVECSKQSQCRGGTSKTTRDMPSS